MRPRVHANPFADFGSANGRSYSINHRSNHKWFEVDLFSEGGNKSIKNRINDLIVETKKVNLWLIFLFIGILILVVRTGYLQLVEGSYFRAVAEGNRVRVRDIKSDRGVIYDRNNRLLVENVPTFSLAIIPVDFPKDKEQSRLAVDELANIANKPKEEIENILSKQSLYSYQPVIIQEDLNHDQAILTQILSGRFSGIVLRNNNTRHYLLTPTTTPSLSHVLGYEGKIEEDKLKQYLDQGYLIDDYVGKAGLEMSYEKELKGVNGREQVEVDATGQAKEVLASQKSVSGQNLVLTIDADLQQYAEETLRKTLVANSKRRGVVIAIDPNSGEVLALVSLPAFDNNLFSHGISQKDFSDLINNPDKPLFNRAISGEYPSGSTFKLIVGSAALQEGLINQNTTVSSVGGIYVDRWFFPDWKAGGHGLTNITKALAESVNTFFYTIGGGYKDIKGLGVAKIKEYAEKFGLSKKLGIDLPNEATGFLPSEEWKEQAKKEMWYIGDTYHLAIGQGDLLVTPIQVATWTSFFANGGIVYRPHLVKEIKDSNNKIIGEIKPQVLSKDFIDPKHIKIIGQGMRQAVLVGSARALQTVPISVAAKTGTAEWSDQKQPFAWITTFAPYEKPNIVLVVLVEEGGEGSSVALPVARDILSWWANNRNVIQ